MLTEPAATAILRLTEDTTAAAARANASPATMVENVPHTAIAEPTKTDATAAMIARAATIIITTLPVKVDIIVPAATNVRVLSAKTAATTIVPAVDIVARAKVSVVQPAVTANRKATKTVATKVATNRVAAATHLVHASWTATLPATTATAADRAMVTAVVPKGEGTAADRKTAVSANLTPSVSTRASSALTTKRSLTIPTSPFASTSSSPTPAFALVVTPTSTFKPA